MSGPGYKTIAKASKLKASLMKQERVRKPKLSSRCWALVRQPGTGSVFSRLYGSYDNCQKNARKGLHTCHWHADREVEARQLDPATKETCQLCGLDPTAKGNEGRQIYVCDACEALVCSDCSENVPGGGLLCTPCDRLEKIDAAEQHEGEAEPEPDRCSRCGAVISRERADRFSLCESCDNP